jgi:hypothetical protein
MIPKRFCGFKTAYLLPINEKWSNTITDMIINDSANLFTLNELLLTGWDLRGSDISGCAGFVLLFDIDYIPTEDDCEYIENAIKAFGGDEKAQKWLDNWTQ